MTDKLQIIADYMPLILSGSWLTIKLALLSLVCATLLGLVGANMMLSSVKVVRFVATTYSMVIRGVPDLVWMLLLFYGVQLTVNDVAEYIGVEPIQIDPFMAGTLTLSLIFAAFFSETFRGATLAVPAGLVEASNAYGMSRWQTFRLITFPLLMRFALPGIRNNWQVLVKSTALVSIIGLDDMVRATDQAGSANHASFLFNLVVAFLFLLITSVSSFGFRHLEKRYNRGLKVIDYGH